MSDFSLWALLPPFYSVCTAIGLWLVYFIAVYSGNVIPLSSEYRKSNGSLYPPYISIAGNFPPASCIFSEVTNLAAFVGLVIGILRFLQLKNRTDKSGLNFLSLAIFALSCFGMTIVGNFQLFQTGIIHDLGALMTFVLGIIYFWIQSYLTLKCSTKTKGKTVAIVRFLLSAVSTLCLILKQALVVIPHMHTVRCQWALVMFFLIFISTFSIEFRHCHFKIRFGDSMDRSISQMETSDVFQQQL